MLSIELIESLGVAAGGTAVGGLSVGWIAKLLIHRYIEQNDQKHQSQDKALREINKALGVLQTDFAVIRSNIVEAIKLRDDVARHDREVAVLQVKVDDCTADIGRGFQSVRTQLKNLTNKKDVQ